MIVPEAITRRRLTLEDYEVLPDDADYEIIEGVLYVSPRARPGHQVVAGRLTTLLSIYLIGAQGGIVIPDGDLIIDAENTYISPDIMYFTAEHYAQINPREFIWVIPDLIVEILSPGTERYDRVTKRNLYARLGVPHYWIADQMNQTSEENVLGPDGHYQSRIVQAPEIFVPALFPGFQIDLGQVFA